MKITSKPKIIISSYDDIKNPYYGGGGAIAIHEVCKRLVDFYEATVITGKYPKSKNEVVDRVFYKRIGTNVFGPKMSQLFFQLLLPFYVMTQQFDIWIESFTPPISTGFLQLFTKKPVIGLVHMLSAEDMQRKYKVHIKLLERLENLGLKTYKYFIVLTEVTKSKISYANKKALFILAPNGVSIPKGISIYQKRSQKYIMFIGRIEINQKGLDLLIDSFSRIARKIDYKLKIVGLGEIREMQKLANLIDSYSLSNQIELVSKVDGVQKKELFENALLVVVPSRFETFSLTALEAFSYGIPLISFDIDGLKWIPKDVSTKIPAFNSKKLSEAILKLCQDVKLRNKLSEKSINFANKYSWESTSIKYKEFLDRVSER